MMSANSHVKPLRKGREDSPLVLSLNRPQLHPNCLRNFCCWLSPTHSLFYFLLYKIKSCCFSVPSIHQSTIQPIFLSDHGWCTSNQVQGSRHCKSQRSPPCVANLTGSTFSPWPLLGAGRSSLPKMRCQA